MHTSRRLEPSRRLEKLEELSQKMANSNHSMKFIRDILISGIKSYAAKVKNSLLNERNPAYRPLYMSTNYKVTQRWKRKQLAKDDWYKDTVVDVKGTDPEAVGRQKDQRKGKNKKKTFQRDGAQKVRTTSAIFLPLLK